MDKRVTRTRETLQHALMSLIVSRGYDAIRVQDICETAGVGRSTFYAHYTDKDDLKRGALDRLKSELSGHCQERLGFLVPLFEHARDHLSLYRALKGSHAEAISMAALRTVLSELVEVDLRLSNPDRLLRDIEVQYIVGATMSVMTRWLDAGAAISVDVITRHLGKLLRNGIPA
jgi:AcrR family transcriptional regulator